eukprot:gnl/TRDRNA2_/TRDRNA2_36126_c0_seq1.p1 gnl/TRDRNA2_/TRDRNA2_36126_c0~~gnl/TRDRNA2_/TRDRNA2_36126_c0_seq1.p1  ORF type:complete len:372 (+),score=85.33 gnl/TRDRNA2_/TRDRNA2_36126_c0_seq1:42-1157(+)
MRRAWPRLARAAGRDRAPSQPPNLRALRDEHVAAARERIFGPQGSMPGDRYLRKKLEGRNLMRWYFPSKYNLQDFRIDEYFEMQAERFAPRKPHDCIQSLTKSLVEVQQQREQLRTFFKSLDEHTFLNNPSLQDLYGLFRLVDPDYALPFKVDERTFKEHSPLFRPSSSGNSEDAAPLRLSPRGRDGRLEVDEAEMAAQWGLLRDQRPKASFDLLDAQIGQQNSFEGVQDAVNAEAVKQPVEVPFRDVTVVLEDGSNDEEPPRRRVAAHFTRPHLGGTEKEKAKAVSDAEDELAKLRKAALPIRKHLAKRHRFVDPMFRRRRLKWLERQMAGKNKETEVKFNSYYATHPDDQKVWPGNKGSVTVIYPSPFA